jgi:hypothetical protein
MGLGVCLGRGLGIFSAICFEGQETSNSDMSGQRERGDILTGFSAQATWTLLCAARSWRSASNQS